jgi:hypothetical protein
MVDFFILFYVNIFVNFCVPPLVTEVTISPYELLAVSLNPKKTIKTLNPKNP